MAELGVPLGKTPYAVAFGLFLIVFFVLHPLIVYIRDPKGWHYPQYQ